MAPFSIDFTMALFCFIFPFFYCAFFLNSNEILLFYFLILLMAVISARSETLRTFPSHWSSSCHVPKRRRFQFASRICVTCVSSPFFLSTVNSFYIFDKTNIDMFRWMLLKGEQIFRWESEIETPFEQSIYSQFTECSNISILLAHLLWAH